MRVCDICRGGGGIATMYMSGLKVDDSTTKIVDDGFDACTNCVELLRNKDWISLAARSSSGQAEDFVKKGTNWLQEQIVPEVKKYFVQKTGKAEETTAPPKFDEQT